VREGLFIAPEMPKRRINLRYAKME
jgi:hypothetical protein